jgi:hypothetical protein
VYRSNLIHAVPDLGSMAARMSEGRIGNHGADQGHHAAVPNMVVEIKLAVGQTVRARQAGDHAS